MGGFLNFSFHKSLLMLFISKNKFVNFVFQFGSIKKNEAPNLLKALKN